MIIYPRKILDNGMERSGQTRELWDVEFNRTWQLMGVMEEERGI